MEDIKWLNRNIPDHMQIEKYDRRYSTGRFWERISSVAPLGKAFSLPVSLPVSSA